jgi:hypothetical protein
VCWVLEACVIVWVALSVSGGLALLALRSMAYACSHSLDAGVERAAAASPRRAQAHSQGDYLRSSEAAMLMIEILLSIGIALMTVGLAVMAALPGRMTVGALLAQFAVLGALTAPPVSVTLCGVRVRPAAMALAVAQLANVVFFVYAIRALL